MNQKTFLSQIKDFIKRPKFFLIATTLLVAIVLGAFFLIKYSIPVPNIFKAEYIEDDNFKLKEVLRFPGTIEKITVKANPMTDNDTVALLRLGIENVRVLNFFPANDMIVMPACEGGTSFTNTEICIDIASQNPLQKDQVLGDIQVQWGFGAESILIGLETNAYYNLNENKLSNYEIEPLEISLFGGLSFTGYPDEDVNSSSTRTRASKNTIGRAPRATTVRPTATKSSANLPSKSTTGSISRTTYNKADGTTSRSYGSTTYNADGTVASSLDPNALYCPLNYSFSANTGNCVNKYTGESVNLWTYEQASTYNAFPKQEVKVSCGSGTFDPVARRCSDGSSPQYEAGREYLCEQFTYSSGEKLSADCRVKVTNGPPMYFAPLWNCEDSWCEPCQLQRLTCSGNDLYRCGGGYAFRIECPNGCTPGKEYPNGGREDGSCTGYVIEPKFPDGSTYQGSTGSTYQGSTGSTYKSSTGSTNQGSTGTIECRECAGLDGGGGIGLLSKLSCGDIGCLNDNDCVTGSPDYSCKKIDGVGKCVLNCKEGETRIDDCTCAGRSAIKREGACGVIDVDGNGKLDYIDLAEFAASYNMICTDSSASIKSKDPQGCGRRDTDGDGKIDYKDLANFATRYHTVKNKCSL